MNKQNKIIICATCGIGAEVIKFILSGVKLAGIK